MHSFNGGQNEEEPVEVVCSCATVQGRHASVSVMRLERIKVEEM